MKLRKIIIDGLWTDDKSSEKELKRYLDDNNWGYIEEIYNSDNENLTKHNKDLKRFCQCKRIMNIEMPDKFKKGMVCLNCGKPIFKS